MSRAKSLYVEVLRDEYDGLRSRVAELEADIVYLKSVEKERNALRAEIAALKAKPSAGVVRPELASFAKRMDEELAKHDIHGYEPVIFAVAEEVARLNPCRAQSVADGYVMVPVETPVEMIEALAGCVADLFGIDDCEDGFREAYARIRAALQAKP